MDGIGLALVRGILRVAGEIEPDGRRREVRIVSGAVRVQVEAPQIVAAGQPADGPDIRVPLEIHSDARFDVLPGAGGVERAVRAELDAGLVAFDEDRVSGGRRRN